MAGAGEAVYSRGDSSSPHQVTCSNGCAHNAGIGHHAGGGFGNRAVHTSGSHRVWTSGVIGRFVQLLIKMDNAILSEAGWLVSRWTQVIPVVQGAIKLALVELYARMPLEV